MRSKYSQCVISLGGTCLILLKKGFVYGKNRATPIGDMDAPNSN